MKQYVYAIAIMAIRTASTEIQMLSCAVLAATDAEAVGKGMQVAWEKWPTSEGWSSHQASRLRVPDDMVQNHGKIVITLQPQQRG